MTTGEVGVRGPREREAAEFTEWVTARQPALRRTAYLLCAGDGHGADDLTQATLAKMYLAWGRLRDRHDIDAYARRVMINEHRSLWRRASRRHEVVAEQLPERPVSAQEYDGERDEVWALVQTLPRKQRAVIVLRYYEDLSEAQIAEALGISTGTVKSQASRALAKLREAR